MRSRLSLVPKVVNATIQNVVFLSTSQRFSSRIYFKLKFIVSAFNNYMSEQNHTSKLMRFKISKDTDNQYNLHGNKGKEKFNLRKTF